RDKRGVTAPDGFPEELLVAHPEPPAAVVVARRGDREDAARLLLRRGEAQRGQRQRALGAGELVDVRPRGGEKRVVARGEVEPGERRRDEVPAVAVGRADASDVLVAEPFGVVGDERLGERRRER